MGRVIHLLRHNDRSQAGLPAGKYKLNAVAFSPLIPPAIGIKDVEYSARSPHQCRCCTEAV